jgi:hypothetical protein
MTELILSTLKLRNVFVLRRDMPVARSGPEPTASRGGRTLLKYRGLAVRKRPSDTCTTRWTAASSNRHVMTSKE